MVGLKTARRSRHSVKKICFTLLLLMAFVGSALSLDLQNDEEILTQAYSMRTSDPQQARAMLASVNRDTLNQATQDLYDNIAAYLFIMEGNFPSAIEAYEEMTAPNRSNNIRFIAHASLTALYSGTQNWSAAFNSLDYISDHIDTIENSEAREQAHGATLNLYGAINENETVISYASSLDYSQYSARFSCVAILQLVSAQVAIFSESLSEAAFDNAMGLCEKANEPIGELGVYAQYATYLYDTGETDKALAMLLEHLPEVEKIRYVPALADYYSLISQGYLVKEDYEQAAAYALKLVGDKQPDAFVSRSDVIAYESLYKVAEAQQQFDLALDYHKRFTKAQSLNISNENAKMLAVQKARQDSAEKSNQIALLDAENSLLRAQAQLDDEAKQNRKLVTIIMLLALLCVGIWIYKKRRHYLILQEISQKDSLTGAANRSHFTAVSTRLVSKCAHTNNDISLVLFDLDDFKSINDTFGHKAGDLALQSAIASTRKGCRELDLIGRLGGEEFGIILEACDLDKALEIAEKCRQEIEKVEIVNSEPFALTASFGVASASSTGHNYDALFDAADKALYRSKGAGKNTVSH